MRGSALETRTKGTNCGGESANQINSSTKDVPPHPGGEGQRWLQDGGVTVEAKFVSEPCDGNLGCAVVRQTWKTSGEVRNTAGSGLQLKI